MSLFCISGLFYFVWTTNGSSISYLSESVDLSCESVQRVYDSNNFYWKLVITVHNVGERDVDISKVFVGGTSVESASIPPPIAGCSVSDQTFIIEAGKSHSFEVMLDAAFSQTVFEKITVSVCSEADKMYPLTIRLI
jgi:hypothetical protein